MGALFDIAPLSETGVFTACIGDCLQAAEFDGFGGLVEPGWTYAESGDDDEFEPGWICPDCRRLAEYDRIAALPITAWTFPA